MKIEAVQYNAMYTLNINGEILIRQFTKYGDAETPNDLIWYEQGENLMMMIIQDEKKIAKLEEEFKKLLE